MKIIVMQLITRITLPLIAVCAMWGHPVSAQNSKTTGKMLYHNGPVLNYRQNLYFIWYGCWNNNCGLLGDTDTMQIVGEFSATIGNTPYLGINFTYPDAAGNLPTAGIIYGGGVVDSSYAHGAELTDADIQGIINDQIMNFSLPQDPEGIYVVISSADISSLATGFCALSARPPYHSFGVINGGKTKYIFLGNPNRCRTLAAPQLFGPGGVVLAPNGSFAADGIVSNLARALNGMLTDPFGTGWFDRYGLENADKCENQFGPTYVTANGARANLRLGQRDFLIQENWVNDRHPRCAMSR